ncbi:RagB/SusD family nutrient uptake outer membrane protein [Pedobacter sp. AW1-32]|uniref:RagB/SusD family nutrient uptake outer membrane protein n=1 Tax=Pedobacter sp. AW1-32 TaxID=3383026 RepID=UPI003FEF3D47
MKKTFYKQILLGGLLSLSVLSSCKDEFLEQKPYTSQATADAVGTEKDMLVALGGAYQGLRNASNFGRNIPVIGDVAGDNVFVSISNSGRYTTFNAYSFTVASSEYAGIWSTLYTTILRANNIINATLASSTTVNQYKGEAYALRALCYFELLQHFARPYTDLPNGPGVPLVLVYDTSLRPSRSTTAAVYSQIQSDLDQAYGLITSYRGTAYISKYAARAIAAKVALFKGDYSTALTYAQDVISNSGFTLVPMTDLVAYWANPASQTSTKIETLFEVVSDATYNLGTDELAYMYSQAGYGDLLAAPALYNLYNSTDVRRSLITVGSRASAENPAYIVTKFKAVSGDRDDKKVIRLSDVYLIAAEAAHSQSTPNDVLALSYLNGLVSKRDNALVYASTGTQLLEDIITERRKELAFEGDRLHTLNRLKRDIARSSAFPTAAQTILYSNFRRIGPIPQDELNANPNMTQNTGY